MRGGNTLFIPEIRFEQGMAGKAFYAIGHHSAMGFSPFSIENGAKEETAEVTAAYKLLNELTPIILNNQGKAAINGVMFDKGNNKEELRMGDYVLTFSHDLTLGWSGKSKDEKWPVTGAIVVQLAADEFIISGTGVVVTFKPIEANAKAGIGYIDEGAFNNGIFKPGLRFSGDQSHQGRHLRIPEGDYSTQKIKLYTYK